MKVNCVFFLMIVIGFSLKAQPSWTPIMDHTTYSNEASAEYFEFNASLGTYPTHVSNTDLAYRSTLTLPLNGSAVEEFGQNDVSPCSLIARPSQQMFRSYYGPSSGNYKGLAFLGQFNALNSGDLGTTSQYNGVDPVLEQSVFFHERQCYDGGREYGVVQNGLDGVVYFYWSTNTNTSTAVVNHYIPATSYTGSQYWFEIWPETDGTSCKFQTRVLGPAPLYTLHDTGTTNVDNGLNTTTITGVDSSFCSAIINETGYVTADLKIEPNITLNSTTSFTLALGGIDIGK